jgi:lipoate-protein ligase A
LNGSTGIAQKMREIFQHYAKAGSMTKEELAKVLKISPEAVRRKAKAGQIPRIPNLREVRFDPSEMIRVFCEPQKPKARSLTIEKPKTAAKTNGGYRKCL